MKDIESDHKYNLVPADYDKAVALSKIIKHVWMDAYVELAGMDFLRVYVPKTFHLIGSPAYETWCSARQKAGRKSPSTT